MPGRAARPVDSDTRDCGRSNAIVIDVPENTSTPVSVSLCACSAWVPDIVPLAGRTIVKRGVPWGFETFPFTSVRPGNVCSGVPTGIPSNRSSTGTPCARADSAVTSTIMNSSVP